MPRLHTNEFPWHAPSDQTRRECVAEAAKLMLNAAHTAPCTGGVDHLECLANDHAGRLSTKILIEWLLVDCYLAIAR